MNSKDIAFMESQFELLAQGDTPWNQIHELLEFAKSRMPVPVTERLPDLLQPVLVEVDFADDYRIWTAGALWSNGEGTKWLDLNGEKIEVAYWMPMPPESE